MIIERYSNKCMAMLTLRNWVLGALLLNMLLPYSASACDSMEQRLSVYWSDGSVAAKAALLQHLLCLPAIDYRPTEIDPMVLKVTVDAIKVGVNRDLINAVLRRHRCAYGARKLPDYTHIIDYIGQPEYASFCQVSRLERLFVVRAEGGALLREEPSIRSQRLASVPQGYLVEVLALFGGWVRVAVISSNSQTSLPQSVTADSVTNRQEGYIYAALLQTY